MFEGMFAFNTYKKGWRFCSIPPFANNTLKWIAELSSERWISLIDLESNFLDIGYLEFFLYFRYALRKDLYFKIKIIQIPFYWMSCAKYVSWLFSLSFSFLFFLENCNSIYIYILYKQQIIHVIEKDKYKFIK